MKNIKLDIIKGLLCVFIISSAVSCNERGFDDYEAGGTPTQALNGEWFIDISDEDGNVYAEHTLHRTFDDNAGKMYISDRIGPEDTDYSGWYLVSKVNYDLTNLTFNASNAENDADGSIVNITEGKILKNAAKSKDGNVVDSIYFKGEFDYDPGTIIIFAGHKRTGFLEDEY
ncbi:Lipid-binding putative hydrolase [compost metagenome]